MAATDGASESSFISTTSYETALCVIPPQHYCQDIDKLRSLYDKGYGKWPPHINLIYPFVTPEHLPRAKALIESSLRRTTNLDDEAPTLTLDAADLFAHKSNSTIFRHGSDPSSRGTLTSFRNAALQAMGQNASDCNFHLTLGQSEDDAASSREFLLSKARLLPEQTFDISTLAILIRERDSGKDRATSRMRLWGTIDLPHALSVAEKSVSEFWLSETVQDVEALDSEEDEDSEPSKLESTSSSIRTPQPGATYQFDAERKIWSLAGSPKHDEATPITLTVSSYNVLIDSEYPPARDRDALLVSTLLSRSALADILVMQEVSDDFLSFLLADEDLRRQYPFASNGPPNQPDIGPLPSLRNIVILSKWNFYWEYVPFHRRHKGAVVARFHGTGKASFVVAGVHLTCGLTNGSVAAKKVQLQNVTSYLKRTYASSPWVLAGDFNITTSQYTIDEALKNKSISQQTSRTLSSIETMLTEAGFHDAWSSARVEGTDDTAVADADDLFEGEEGATFNPRENVLAAAMSGTSNNRPQRYDRILVRPQDRLVVGRFNQFGLPGTQNGAQQVPSDHSGIRASLKLHTDSHSKSTESLEILNQYPVIHKQAPSSLSTSGLHEILAKHNVFPTADEENNRKAAFSVIETVIIGSSDDGNSTAPEVPLKIVSVGSYALGVWTSASDIDCLCVGSISSKTFFKLAGQRIHKAESLGVRLLRKVEANTGTMLELSVNGVNVDLQYCPAASVVQRWSEFPQLPPSDPIFNLPILSLRKLKPYRDLLYIQRTLPSTATYRLAYHCIKLWAVQRGLYSAKFGYLGGIHITLMLSWVCKRLSHDNSSVSASDLIATFFHHYGHFDWEHEMVFDAFFHKKKPRYQRSVREPMAILGFYAPNSNIAHTSTVFGLRTLVQEFKLADERLSAPGKTWDSFFMHGGFSKQRSDMEVEQAATPSMPDFLTSHESYIKVDIQFWGRTLSKGKSLVGWVESRCISLVVDINKALPDLSVRIWPARFTDKDSSDSETYYHGCYLVGLSRSEDDDTGYSKDDRLNAKATLHKTFDRFLTQVKADEKSYDPNTCWIGLSLAKPKEVKSLLPDDREWGDYVAEYDPDFDDEEEEDVDDFESDQASLKLPVRPTRSSSSTPVSSSKLRPASDVLNRLRWDSNLDPGDYVVGYEDRFLGAKETTLEKWKTEQTDDEFIPQHRILYFKRKGEDGGEVVWDRARRIDKIFGSGIGAGDSDS